RTARPAVRRFGPWVRWPGRWGDSEGRLPFEEPSPRGPAFQDGERFTEPGEAEARPCGSGPPDRDWVWQLAGALALAVAVAIGVRRRATYNRPP
ncbi:MAG: hypothetical protein M3340_16510, partial [Actinomycetota bacterium]|nr:hypothetical protein [Actinomycetota bacterium]